MTPGFDWTREDFARQLRQSSFGPGALLVSPDRRRDLEVFYAYCRAIDDCADEFGPAEARRHFKAWRKALDQGGCVLAADLDSLCERRGIPQRLLMDLIAGAESDLRPKVGFSTRKELLLYCHRVAGAVGAACLPIFGIGLKQGEAYAETLGRAFQLINIIRDAKEDEARGRDYFARSDRKRAVSRENLLVMYAVWAVQELGTADRLALALPAKELRPSQLMRKLYGALLEEMVKDGLRVYEKRYRLPWWRKLLIVGRALL